MAVDAVDRSHRFALQVFTGTSFTLLAFATGGLAAPIVAHCLYDWYTFYESHLAVTGQMEYSVEEGERLCGNQPVRRVLEVEAAP